MPWYLRRVWGPVIGVDLMEMGQGHGWLYEVFVECGIKFQKGRKSFTGETSFLFVLQLQSVSLSQHQERYNYYDYLLCVWVTGITVGQRDGFVHFNILLRSSDLMIFLILSSSSWLASEETCVRSLINVSWLVLNSNSYVNFLKTKNGKINNHYESSQVKLVCVERDIISQSYFCLS